MITRQDIADALNELGDDPAAALRERGVKGLRSECDRCPIANYLVGRFALARQQVEVESHQVTIDPRGRAHTIDLSDALSSFVDAFDEGEFPDLVALHEDE